MMEEKSFHLPSTDEVRTMSYAELQKLAKSMGLRANLKKSSIMRNVINRASVFRTPVPELEDVESKAVTNDKKVTVEREDVVKRHVRRRTFDKEEAEMGALTPHITFKPDPLIRLQEPSQSKKKCILAPQRIPKKSVEDGTKIPRPERVLKESSITKRSVRSTPDFARIHKRLFEQMDTLEDYVVKKQVRACKLQDVKSDGKSKKIPPNGLTPFRSPAVRIPAKPTPSILAPVLAIKDANFNFAQLSATNAARTPSQKLKVFKFTQNSKTNSATNSSLIKETKKKLTFGASDNPREMKSIRSRIPVRERKSILPREEKNKSIHQQLYKANNRDREKMKTKQREYVKGVRSNRRFDLQMKSRIII